MNKVYVEFPNQSYYKMFREMGFEIVFSPEAADLICFTGGSDVSSHFYEEPAHKFTHSDIHRDQKEAKLFNWCLNNKKKMVGICRGGQFLNVMSGGIMYQHVTNHTRYHDLVDLETGETIYVSSTHHQMMKPSDKALIVAVANQKGTREWYENQIFYREISEDDYEVLYYEHTKCLCFQPHPEFDDMPQMRRYFSDLLTRFHSFA